jgi:hypothetical protein
VSPQIIDDHNICVQLVKGYQTMHMAGGREQPYMDLGYNLVGCPHRKVFMGRGAKRIPAANGAGLNSAHYAVLALVGSSGFVVPNDGLLHAIRDGIDYLREHGNAGNEIRGHRDGFSTSCPGDRLYAWVKKGAPRPGGGSAAKPSTREDDDVSAEDVLHGKHIKLNKGEKGEEKVSLAYCLQHLETEQDAMKAMLAQALARLDALGK